MSHFKNYKDFDKQCLYCAEYFKDPSITHSLFGVCPRCKEEPILGCTCNHCGQPISLQEYDSNVEGYCEYCQDELEENEDEM